MKKCKCNPLEKLLVTNFPYFRCPKCGAEYLSSGNATVIDKCELGSIAQREQQLNEKAKEFRLSSPSINKHIIEKIQNLVKDY